MEHRFPLPYPLGRVGRKEQVRENSSVVHVIAHRGATARCRENTVEAFREAARLGADGVELDVRRCADGALVVHHDPVLPTGERIAELTASQLPEWVPTLEAAIDACGSMLVNMEVKNLPTEPGFDPGEEIASAMGRFVAERRLQRRVVVSSFTLASLDAVRAVDGDAPVPTAWLTLAGYDQLAAVAAVLEKGHSGLHPRHEAVTAELVAAAHGAGLDLRAWTVDQPQRVRWLAGLGVDAIITNVPDVARDALGAGG